MTKPSSLMVAESAYEPTTARLGLLVMISSPETVHVWTGGDDALRPLPADVPLGPSLVCVTAASDGRSVLLSPAVTDDDEGLQSPVIHRWSLAGGAAKPLQFPAKRSRDQMSVTVTDPSGLRCARLLTWRDTPPAAPVSIDHDWRCALEVLDAAGELTEPVTWRGQGFCKEGEDQFLQWSPRGDLIAVEWTDTPGAPATALIDAVSGQVMSRMPGSLLGSASFSPDGTRLLMTDGLIVRVWDIETGRLDPVVLLPETPELQENRPGTRRALGFADNEHLLYVTQRGRAMTVWRGRLDEPDGEPVLRWTGGLHMYVTMCRPTPDFWMF